MDFPKSVPGVGLVAGRYVNEDSATGQVGTLVVAEAMNALTLEILGVILGAGLVPDEDKHDQLFEAIRLLLPGRWSELEQWWDWAKPTLEGLWSWSGGVDAAISSLSAWKQDVAPKINGVYDWSAQANSDIYYLKRGRPWVDVTAARAIGVSYENTADYAKKFAITIAGTNAGDSVVVSCNGVQIYNGDPGFGTSPATSIQVFGEVNVGGAVHVAATSGVAISKWVEYA